MHPNVGPWLWTVFLTLGEGAIAYLTVTEAGVPIGWAIAGFVVAAALTFLAVRPTRDRTLPEGTASELPPANDQ